MSYFVFTKSAPQAAAMENLKNNLLNARRTAEQLQAQLAQMDATQSGAQIGRPADLNHAALVTTIDSVVTALEDASVTNVTSRVGFA